MSLRSALAELIRQDFSGDRELIDPVAARHECEPADLWACWHLHYFSFRESLAAVLSGQEPAQTAWAAAWSRLEEHYAAPVPRGSRAGSASVGYLPSPDDIAAECARIRADRESPETKTAPGEGCRRPIVENNGY